MKTYTIETTEEILYFEGVTYHFNCDTDTWHFLDSRHAEYQNELVVKDSVLQHFRVEPADEPATSQPE